MAIGCEHGWHHVTEDWVVLEPVDSEYRPVPPGVESDSVLVSNLANRIQPILCYELGDRVLLRPDPCPCGNLLRAIRVRGRSADVLTFATDHGERISMPPLVFEIDHVPGVELSQVVQDTPTSLRVRLIMAPNADTSWVWEAVHAELTNLLAEHGLRHVTVKRATEPPEQSRSGKYRTVIPLS